MARETAREVAIQEATETPIYQDQKQIVRQLGAHLSEAYIAQGTGAGGVGFDIENVPFEPAVITAINQGGATPAVHHSVFSPTPAHATVAAAAAANATPPTLTQVGEGDWTVTVPVGMAPNGEVVTLLIYGVRDVAGGL